MSRPEAYSADNRQRSASSDRADSPPPVNFEDLPRCEKCGGVLSPWPPFLGPEGTGEFRFTVCGCDALPVEADDDQ